MVAIHFVALLATTFVGAASASAVQDDWVLTLLKRQEPGTPAYACHSSCGNAITKSRGTDPCNDSTFVSEYTACIACSGPSDVNIWRYYGRTLSVAGTKCGLPTEPSSGSPATSAPPAPSPQPVTTSSTPAEPSPAPVTTSAPPVETVTRSEISATSTVVSTLTDSSAVAPAPTTAPIIIRPTGTTPSGNGTSTTSSTIQFTGGADSHKVFGMGSFAAAVLAFMI